MYKAIKESIDEWFNGRNINYTITDERYGSKLKIIYVDRFIHDHLFFNSKGYGIVIRGEQ